MEREKPWSCSSMARNFSVSEVGIQRYSVDSVVGRVDSVVDGEALQAVRRVKAAGARKSRGKIRMKTLGGERWWFRRGSS